MKYISENEYHAPGRDEFKIMVVASDKDAIYLECTKEELDDTKAIRNFLNENNVQFDEYRISCYKQANQ